MGFSSDGNFWRTDKQSSGLTFERTASQSSLVSEAYQHKEKGGVVQEVREMFL